MRTVSPRFYVGSVAETRLALEKILKRTINLLFKTGFAKREELKLHGTPTEPG